MFRAMGRVLCILLVAGAIAGAFDVLAGAYGGIGAGSNRRGAGERVSAAQPPPAFVGAEEPDGPRAPGFGDERGPRGVGARGRGHGGHHGERSLGRGVAGALATLLQASVIVAVVATAQSRWRRRRRA
jgi:hypothetical protein